ncbi:unnamed protein product [Cuscuta epithymum]|uniref:Transmembrane protein n=1 Tax=Cuscuta epithymum TaxID=186058 RepID=A0AAV0F9B2_9ASTE|nr:unnamed protein product [Cuscuta epithymum]
MHFPSYSFFLFLFSMLLIEHVDNNVISPDHPPLIAPSVAEPPSPATVPTRRISGSTKSSTIKTKRSKKVKHKKKKIKKKKNKKMSKKDRDITISVSVIGFVLLVLIICLVIYYHYYYKPKHSGAQAAIV